jgi:hypothetical protein
VLLIKPDAGRSKLRCGQAVVCKDAVCGMHKSQGYRAPSRV